jgi:ATP-dependent Clp protease ATP-binding subunit ClpA
VEEVVQGFLEEGEADETPLFEEGELEEKPLSEAVQTEHLWEAMVEAGQEEPTMWQRFTERTRRIIFFAQEEAARLGENYVGTEHLLLGLLREDDSAAGRILLALGADLAAIRKHVSSAVKRGEGREGQEMQLTPCARRVIDIAYEESRALKNNYIGTEHLLIGLAREEDGLARKALDHFGLTTDILRRETLKQQNHEGGATTDEAKRSGSTVILHLMTNQGLATVPFHAVKWIRVMTEEGEIEGQLKSITTHVYAEAGGPANASASEDAEGTEAPPPA